MEQILGRQPELRNKDSIHSFLFSFVYFQLLYLLLFFNYWDENSNSVLTLFVNVFRIKYV